MSKQFKEIRPEDVSMLELDADAVFYLDEEDMGDGNTKLTLKIHTEDNQVMYAEEIVSNELLSKFN